MKQWILNIWNAQRNAAELKRRDYELLKAQKEVRLPDPRWLGHQDYLPSGWVEVNITPQPTWDQDRERRNLGSMQQSGLENRRQQ